MFIRILLEKLVKIPYLDDVPLDAKAVIYNFNHIPEQDLYRDYKSVRKY